MPLGNVSTGVHDDGLHDGSAKRDVAKGVAGLDNQGNLLSLHDTVYIPLGLSDKAFLTERTTGELLVEFERLGVMDYQAVIEVATAREIMLNTSHADVAGFYAALDSRGHLNPKVNAYAPLLVDLSMGITHPFIATAVSGNGTAVDDVSAGVVVINTGDTLTGYAELHYERSYGMRDYVASMCMEIPSMYIGAGGSRSTMIGFKLDWTSSAQQEMAVLFINSVGTTVFRSAATSGYIQTTIPTLASRDSVQILIQTGYAVCVVNGVIVAVHTTNLPTSASMNAGAAVHGDSSVTTGMNLNITGFNVSRSG